MYKTIAMTKAEKEIDFFVQNNIKFEYWEELKRAVMISLPSRFRKKFSSKKADGNILNKLEKFMIDYYHEKTGVLLEFRPKKQKKKRLDRLTDEMKEDVRNLIADGENWEYISDEYYLTRFDIWEMYKNMEISPKERKVFVEKKDADKYGENHPNSILTEKQAIDIKIKALNGIPRAKLSEEYKISKQMVSMIKNGKRWSHLKISKNS